MERGPSVFFVKKAVFWSWDFDKVALENMTSCFSKLDIFFKKNEEVIWSVHLLTYLLKFGERGPSVF
jgi:hypothetical protein